MDLEKEKRKLSDHYQHRDNKITGKRRMHIAYTKETPKAINFSQAEIESLKERIETLEASQTSATPGKHEENCQQCGGSYDRAGCVSNRSVPWPSKYWLVLLKLHCAISELSSIMLSCY